MLTAPVHFTGADCREAGAEQPLRLRLNLIHFAARISAPKCTQLDTATKHAIGSECGSVAAAAPVRLSGPRDTSRTAHTMMPGRPWGGPELLLLPPPPQAPPD